MNIYKKVFDGKNIGEILYDEPMKNHTTFKIGGSCDVMIFPQNEEQIINALKLIKQNGFAYRIIGNGSNLLVSDDGLREVVIKLHDNFNDMKITGDTLKTQSGALLSAVSKLAINNSYAGFEAVSGIPGDIGGAITMNAGAYGTEMKDIVHRVKVIDTDLNVKYFNCDEMDFSYRHSRVQDEKLIVLEVEFLLKKGDQEEIFRNYHEYTERRTSKQPLELPSCGSVFKRPEGHFAGQLIDEAGLRGYRYNDAMVSEKHCGFIVNVGEAKCSDVVAVIEHVQKVVMDKFDVKLEPEVRIIGGK
ncbi:MAG: UDP-N-acetylmuramate dehydrogenase [Finegoldia magna]|nr:UDP-N-acetylmuramate dehydrogenase [Finegoldia magna]